MKMKLCMLLSAYTLPMLAMQTQDYVNCKNDVQRKTIEQLQKSISNLQNAIDSVKSLENFPSEEDQEEVTFLARFRAKQELNAQELVERYKSKRQSEFAKSGNRNLA